MNRIQILALGALIASPALAQDEAAHAEWYDDFDKAAAAAKEAKKDLLVDFTGSDWCGWCIKLDKEVFSHEPFLTGVADDYVLVALDFPRGEEAKAKVPNPERNQELSQKFGVRGYPTILLVTPEGEVFGRTGYREGGPENYVEHLAELSASGKAALASAKQIEKKLAAADTRDAKVAVVREAIALLEEAEAGSVGVDVFERVARNGLTLDPQNESGLKLETVSALIGAGILDEEVEQAGRELDPKNEEGLIEKIVVAQIGKVNSEEAAKATLKSIEDLLALGVQEKETEVFLLLNASFWSKRILEDDEKSKKLAQQALDLGVENPRYKQALEQLANG